MLPWLEAQQLPPAPQLLDVNPVPTAPATAAAVRIDEDEAVTVPADIWSLDPQPADVPAATECTFSVCGGTLTIAAKVWSPAGHGLLCGDTTCDSVSPEPTKRVLAWPGWLDNAGSFDNLAPLMVQDGGYTIVCVDPPGCGRSDHLPKTAQYCTETETLMAVRARAPHDIYHPVYISTPWNIPSPLSCTRGFSI